MRKFLILIAFITLPAVAFSQNVSNDTLEQPTSVSIETVTTPSTTENQTVLSASAKAEVSNLSYKKSNDLISIKAYRKSLQIKVKEIKNC